MKTFQEFSALPHEREKSNIKKYHREDNNLKSDFDRNNSVSVSGSD